VRPITHPGPFPTLVPTDPAQGVDIRMMYESGWPWGDLQWIYKSWSCCTKIPAVTPDSYNESCQYCCTESLVSPRTHKRVQCDPPGVAHKSVPVILASIPEDDEDLFQPPSPTPQSNPSPLPQPIIRTPVGGLENPGPKKRKRFPSEFPAHYVLPKVSQYLNERRHGESLMLLKRICAPHSVGRTMSSAFPKLYGQYRAHFMTLDRETQLSITWSQLGVRAQAANTPADKEFIAFTDPGPLPIPVCPANPGTSSTSFVIPPVPQPTAPTIITNPMVPMTPTPPDIAISLPPVTAQQTLHTPAPFPLDANVLQPLLPEQRAVLDAEYDLIHAISRDFCHTNATCVEGLTDQRVNPQLRCPFCDTELPGTEYSPALKDLLNSRYIQENTEPDPTLQNPNSRRSLKGHQVYLDFCSRHRFEELLPDVKAAGWPYPPNFANLQHCVHSKGTYINELIVGIQTGSVPSQFYLDVLAMNERQRREQAQDIVAAG